MITSIKEDNTLSKNQQLLLAKMQKCGKGAEITIATAAKILQVSPSAAGRILNKLADMGYLNKLRKDRKNIYILQ
jgi:Mn-dependent DtxR family transcriptional regulator